MTTIFAFSLFAAGVLVGVVNVLAGGGSALTLPLMILMGMDPSVANGTNRVAIIAQSVSAIGRFSSEKMHNFRQSLTYGLMTIPGAVLGAFASVKISDEAFRLALAVVMVLIVLTMLAPSIKPSSSQGKAPRWLMWPAMFGIGLYGGFIQAGVGFPLMAALVLIAGNSLRETNIHKVVIVFVLTIPALILFILTDNVNWLAALFLSVGSMIGGWLGAHLNLTRGERLIRVALALALLLMAARLLFA